MLFLQKIKQRRKLLIGMILVVITSLVFLGWQVWQSDTNSEDTTEWATYGVNIPDSDSFTFRYPRSEYVQLRPATTGRLLRLQNYDPNTSSRSLDGRYRIEFFVNTEGHFVCERDVVNAENITNTQGLIMRKGQTAPNEGGGFAGGDIAVCIERSGYVLYIKGSDHTGEGIVEQIIDSISYIE